MQGFIVPHDTHYLPVAAVARLRTSTLTVTPSQAVCDRADLLVEYRVIVMTLNLANELVYQMK
uniref:Uncharacterized protein n=1 Tax=Timema douglasi TaxID=61478 RepID=A0A7R8ZHB7_TIMDO|nr:unnamed protein product [Timema douglasi]